MSYPRAFCQFVFDYPHCDGMLTRLGIGRDWEAREPRQDEWAWTGDVSADLGWHYGGQFEYLKTLRGIAPVGTWGTPTMALSQWTQTRGLWREAPTTAASRFTYLHYYDARPNRYAAGAWGTLTSTTSYTPNQVWYIWRGPNLQGDSDAPMFCIAFGNTGGIRYAITLPAYREAGAWETGLTGNDGATPQPALWGYSAGQWNQIATMDSSSVPRMGAVGAEPVFQCLRTEYIDGHLIVRMNESDTEWTYTGPWKDVSGREYDFVMGAGPVEVNVIGHTAQFAMQQITYPTTAHLRPAAFLFVPPQFAQTENSAYALPLTTAAGDCGYYIIGETPSGTGLSATRDTHDQNEYMTRPRVTFSGDGTNRATLYCVQEYRISTVGNATSNPVSSADTATFSVLAASGACNDQWRGATMSGTCADISGARALNDIAPNAKIYCNVSCDKGVSYARQFTGYTVPPSKEMRGGEPGWIEGQWEAYDIIQARLAKKQLLWQPSFEGNGTTNGWNIASAFRYILAGAGVDSTVGSSMVDIATDVAVSTTGMEWGQYYGSGGTLKGQRKLKFGPDTCVVDALDALVDSRTIASAAVQNKRVRLRWGVDYNGQIFLGREYEHQAGRYLLHSTERSWSSPPSSDGWVLDAYTATATDWASQFRSSRTIDDFRNLLYVVVGEGLDAAAKVLIHEHSFSDSASALFIGDLWTHFEMFPDGSDLTAIAQSLWENLWRWNWTISFTIDDWPALMPDDEIYVTGFADVEVPDGSIYKVASKSWNKGQNGRYQQTVDCVLVEEPS